MGTRQQYSKQKHFRLLAGLTSMFVSLSVIATPPSDAIPFYCSATAPVGTEVVLTCRRSDTRELVTPVPTGMLLFVTDIIANPAGTDTSGVFTATIGRYRSEYAFPGRPVLDLIGHPTAVLNFTTPYIILRPAADLAVANFAESDFDIEVWASGYMARTFVEPPAETVFQDGFEVQGQGKESD